MLTEYALRTHRNGLDDVTPRADARVEQDGKLALLLRAAHPRRRSDLLECVKRANSAINLTSACRPRKRKRKPPREVPSAHTQGKGDYKGTWPHGPGTYHGSTR